MNKLRWLSGAWIALALAAHAEKVTYLGVATVPLHPVAAYQLDLPAGVGLAVVQVAADGVVQGKLVANDVLHKLDDQILTSPEQLAVLVRGHQPGDTIKLTVIRKGKTEVLKVQLGATDARNVTAPMHRQDWPLLSPYDPLGGDSPADLRRRMEQLQRRGQDRWSPDDDDEATVVPAPRAPRAQRLKEAHSSSVITETRDGMTVTLTNRDGEKTVRAEEHGQVLVDGQAVNTPEQLQALPEKVRARVSELQKQYPEESNPPPPPRGHGPRMAL
jgi:hypothetical protein